MMPKYIGSGSESESDESEDDFDGTRFKVESQLNVKRFLKILVIVLLFLVSASILIVSVLHDLKERRTVEFEEFSCSASDSLCLANLCPVGMTWHVPKQICKPAGETSSRPPDILQQTEPPVKGTGLVMGAYKEECSPGFLWVSWRHRCMRLTG